MLGLKETITYSKLFGSPAFQFSQLRGFPVDIHTNFPSSPWSVPLVQKCSCPKPILSMCFSSSFWSYTKTNQINFKLSISISAAQNVPILQRKVQKVLKSYFYFCLCGGILQLINSIFLLLRYLYIWVDCRNYRNLVLITWALSMLARCIPWYRQYCADLAQLAWHIMFK